MGQHVATNWLLRISMSHRVAWVSHHLIRHVDGYVELLSQFHDPAENSSQQLLPL